MNTCEYALLNHCMFIVEVMKLFMILVPAFFKWHHVPVLAYRVDARILSPPKASSRKVLSAR